MNRCAFPECSVPIIDHSANTILAEVCHICARSRGGPRFDGRQSDEERHGFDNLILMCGVHHKLIDAPENIERFSIGVLLQMKADHECTARQDGTVSVQLSEDQLELLQTTAGYYELGSVHNDFRQAVFRVGGEGGQWGGGGGGGGILTIVGTTRVPPDVSLSGEDGRAPGGGGGGGGGVQCVGRPADTDDLALGLKLTALLLANAHSASGALVNLLGAGWSFLPISSLPATVHISLVLGFDLGRIEPCTLVRFNIEVLTPSRTMALETALDVGVPDCIDLVKRTTRVQSLSFEVKQLGVWRILVRSAHHELGAYSFECRSAQ